MTYTRIPAGNLSRNETQLRATVDAFATARANLRQIADKMAQMNLDGGGTRLAQEYNLQDADDASEIYALVTSASDEQGAASPFTTQLIQRIG
jgi:hypothetical protein